MTSRSSPITYTFMPVSHCDMCGSSDFRMLGIRLNRSQGMRPRQADGIAVSVKQCRDCDLIFSDPHPFPKHLSDHYGIPAEDYWTPEVFNPPPGYFANEISAAKRLLPFRNRMTALDVGAGVGNAMRALTAAGFDTWGLEPAEPFYRRAVERVEPGRLLRSTIEDAEFATESFDFITFGAVLEHLHSPSHALNRALKWLKPGGIIQAEVPSSHYFPARIIDAYFLLRGTNYVTHISPMHPPFHLFEFSLRSFKNYNVVEHYFMVGEIMHFPRPLHPLLRWWMGRTDTGMQLTVYLTR